MFNTKIPLYAICILLSLVANVLVTFLIAKKRKFPKIELICLLLYENIGIIVGAKLFTLFNNFNRLKEVGFLKIGLSSYGAVIGALIGIIIFNIQFKFSIQSMKNIIFPGIPLMYSIGKIGCFLAGCCHGIEYDHIFSVTYNYSVKAISGVSYFPVQICETIVFLLIFIYVIRKVFNDKFDNVEFYISLIMCACAKFLLDFLRISHVNKIISVNQIVSLIFIIVSIVLLYREKTKKVL